MPMRNKQTIPRMASVPSPVTKKRITQLIIVSRLGDDWRNETRTTLSGNGGHLDIMWGFETNPATIYRTP